MKIARRLEWSKRSLQDRDRIARFYNEEASLLVAVEADAAIQRAADQACAGPELFRSAIRPNTREYVMRRLVYFLSSPAIGLSELGVLRLQASFPARKTRSLALSKLESVLFRK